MFENGIKGGVSAYSGGVLTTQVSVPFGFSAYPKIQGNTTTTNNNTTVVQQGGGGHAAGASTVNNLAMELDNAANQINSAQTPAQLQAAQNTFNTINSMYTSATSFYGQTSMYDPNGQYTNRYASGN